MAQAPETDAVIVPIGGGGLIAGTGLALKRLKPSIKVIGVEPERAASFKAALDAEVIFVIGANPTINHPVAATYIKQAAKAGAKLVVMDPRRQQLYLPAPK